MDPADDLAGREDRQTAPSAKKKPSAPADPIGEAGARKLLDLAARKKVRLDDFLEPHGCKFTPLSEVSKEVGRAVYRQLQGLPDPPAAPSCPPSPPLNLPPATANGHAAPKSSVPF